MTSPDAIINVVFMGAPSTGKTTVARACAELFNTVWMPEYGLEYWLRHQVDRRLTPEQLVELAEGHLQREEALLEKANKYLFTDTNPISTYMFALYYHNSVHPRLIELAHQAETRYDVFFLCEPDIPYEEAWDRSGEVYREEFQRQIVDDLERRNIKFHRLRGSNDERLKEVVRVLEDFDLERTVKPG